MPYTAVQTQKNPWGSLANSSIGSSFFFRRKAPCSCGSSSSWSSLPCSTC
uniref:Uncharacterized protein n=1 Tax=Arundo donax TaxID=35708 RepID=A0A0A9H5E0_ARUDO